MAKYSYNHRTRTIDTETRCVAMVDDNSMTSHIIAELNTLATEKEALHARVAELEAERDQWKEAAISENKLSVERWEEVAKWKHDYFAMRDTLLDIPEYVNWVTDGSDYENLTAPADDSVFAPIANGDVCVFCYHSFDDPCENHPTCQDTGNPYHAADDTEPVEVVQPLDSEPRDRYVKVSWSACEDYDEYHQTCDLLNGCIDVFTSSDEEAVDNDVLRRNTLWRLNGTPTTTESEHDA